MSTPQVQKKGQYPYSFSQWMLFVPREGWSSLASPSTSPHEKEFYEGLNFHVFSLQL